MCALIEGGKDDHDVVVVVFGGVFPPPPPPPPPVVLVVLDAKRVVRGEALLSKQKVSRLSLAF